MDTAQNLHVDESLAFIDSAYNALKSPSTGDLFVKDSIKSIKYRLVKNEYLHAVLLLDSLMDLIKGRTSEEKYAVRYAATLYQKGECFANMKRYNEALHYFSLAEDATFHLVKNKCNLIYYSGSKAYMMFAQEKYLEAAAAFLQQSRVFLNDCGQTGARGAIDLQRCQNNIALSYLRAGLPDSAIFYENEALKTISNNEYKYPYFRNDFYFSRAVIYGDQAEVLSLKGRYTEAEELFKKSLAGTVAADVPYAQATLARLADVYLKNNKKDSARRVLDQLKLSLDALPGEKQLLSWYKLSVKYYAQTKQVKPAFTHQQRYEAIRDSIETRDKKFATVDIGKEFENLELKYSNEVLKKEGKLKTLYLIIAIFTFIAITAIAVFVWYNLRRTRKLHLQVKQKNDDMQKAYSSLEQSHEENNRIIRIVAHDLKSPISAINNLIFSLLRKDYPGDLKEIFQLIKTACGNSMVLINDALSEKKDRTIIRKELIDMKRLLEYCVDLLQAKADEKKQQLTLEAENIMLMLNRQKMWRVVSNIVNNAIKFSPEHTVIDIKLQRKEHCVLLSVHDKGIGIPADLKDKIFTKSPEASRYGTAGEEPYGLGLSISQQIIEEHDGRIWFDSVDGKGAVFYVELPYSN